MKYKRKVIKHNKEITCSNITLVDSIAVTFWKSLFMICLEASLYFYYCDKVNRARTIPHTLFARAAQYAHTQVAQLV